MDNDILSGSGGNNTVFGGQGSDTMTGGSSFDKFRFTSDSADDVVVDQFVPCFSTNFKFRQTTKEPA